MAISVNIYNSAIDTLFSKRFEEEAFIYCASLIRSSYIFNKNHTNISDLGSSIVGSPVILSGKKKLEENGNVFFYCKDIDFSDSGSIDASHMVVHFSKNALNSLNDPLVLIYSFDGGSTQSVSRPIQVSTCGLIAIKG